LNEQHHSFSSVRYRVREPLLAVRNEPGVKLGFMTILPGSVITAQGTEQQSGFVVVSLDSQIVKVFTSDILKRTDRVVSQGDDVTTQPM
jgi:hypothetical protein